MSAVRTLRGRYFFVGLSTVFSTDKANLSPEGALARRRLRREKRLHLAPQLVRGHVRVDGHVGPRKRLPLDDIAKQPDIVGQRQRQASQADGFFRRKELAPHRGAAFAVERRAG